MGLFRVRQDTPKHDEEHEGVACQHTDVPDLMIAKMRREGIGLSEGEDQCANGVAQSTRNEQ